MRFYKKTLFWLPHDRTFQQFLPQGADLETACAKTVSDYLVSTLTSDFVLTPLTSPMINMTAGINCPTTTIAKKPRKIQMKIPSFPAGTFAAANAVAGAIVPITVANVFMAFSFQDVSLVDL